MMLSFPNSIMLGFQGSVISLRKDADRSRMPLLREVQENISCEQQATRKNRMMDSKEYGDITFLARANYHDKRRVFGIRLADRRAHMYIVGKTGSGKSTLLETLVRQDVEAGHGLALLDPHGDLVERILAGIPPHRKDDVIYFNVPDVSRPLAFNPLETRSQSNPSLAVYG